MKTNQSFKDLELIGWENKAVSYDLFTKVTCQAINPILNSIGNLRNTRLLEVACGTGHLAGEASRRGARVEGTDFSEEMLKIAKKNYSDVAFSKGDAENLPYPDGIFNSVVCSFGVLHFENPDSAISEAYRVLKHNGKYIFTAWRSPEQGSDFMNIIFNAIKTYGTLDVDLPPAPPIFRFSDPQECEITLKRAGFSDAQASVLNLKWTGEQPEDLITLIYNSIVRTPMILEAQTSQARENIHKAIIESAGEYKSVNGVEIDFPATMIIATK